MTLPPGITVGGVQDEPYDPPHRVRLGDPRVVVVCDNGHGNRRRFRANFLRTVSGGWIASRADTIDERTDVLSERPLVRGGVVIFQGGFEIVCSVCGKPVRIHDDKLFTALDAVVSLGGNEVQLAVLARLVGQ